VTQSGAPVVAVSPLVRGAVLKGPTAVFMQAAGLSVDADGVVIGERTFEGRASCAELGRMAAIVIASWESDVHPEFARQPAEIVRSEPSRAPERPAPARSAAAYDVAAGVTFGQADTPAAGASIGAAWFPRGVGLGLWILGVGDLARTIAVGAHEARWRRGWWACVW